jgi:lysine/ornithine N-monooxygenase
MSATDALIIGAGPYGLSISAHLRSRGVQHVIVGRPLETWRTYMPDGMNLKSEPYGSDFASPSSGYDVAGYCRSSGLDFVARLGPLSRKRFLDYGDWYVRQLVPDILDDTVTQVVPANDGFGVSLQGTGSVVARSVVVATGVRPHAHIPAELAGLPAHLVSHTIDHGHLEQFKGRRVAVVGAGQSALETAALLHEIGADVRVLARARELSWNVPNPEHLSPIGHIRRPTNHLCEGWRCTFWNTPEAYHFLPRDVKIRKTRTVLGPAGSWWLRSRIDGVVEVLVGHRVVSAVPHGSGVRLSLAVSHGAALGPDIMDVDHVIAGTGFRTDLARLPFLPESLRSAVSTDNGYPTVSRVGESTVPGLYFAGATTAFSLGPSARFIAGTHNVAAKLAKSLARGRRGDAVRPEPEVATTVRDGVTA